MADQRQAGKRGLLSQRQGADRFPLKWAHEYLAVALPPPHYPIDVRGGAGPGQMWGNDTVADCGECGIDFIELYTAWRAQVALPNVTAAIAEGRYFAFTGGQDTGVVLADFLLWLYQHGYIKGFAPAPHTDRATCDSLMQLFDTPLYCGGALYDNSEAQFNAGQTWDPAGLAPDQTLGHCIDKVYSDGISKDEWRTWAAFQAATLSWGQGFLAAPSGEAWVVITNEEQKAMFNEQLWADLATLPSMTGTPPPPPPVPTPAPPCAVNAGAVSTGLGLVTPSQWAYAASKIAPFLPRRTIASAWSWVQAAAIKVGRAFLLSFLPPVIAAGAGMFNLGTLKVAAVGGLVAAAMALDALIGNAVNPGSVGTVHALGALRARRWQARAWAYYQRDAA